MSRGARTATLAVRTVAALSFAWSAALAQEHGAAQLRSLVRGLTVTPRVLVIGARPEDDEGQLLAWLARGRMIETGFLSLTRGESGQNFLGSESGTVFGAVRTQELMEARRIDGAEQFFTRAYDFGFSRSAAEVFKRWARDSVVGDMVTIVRSFRPQVMVAAVTEGFPGNDGQEQALGVLAREAFDAATDTVRFPARQFGLPWTPLALYENGSGVVIDPNELDPVLGKTFPADIATESRAARRSEGFGDGLMGRVGTVRLTRVASRATATPPDHAQSLFDGIDTTFARLIASAPSDTRDAISLIAAYADSARAALDLEHPDRVLGYVGRVAELAMSARTATPYCRHPAADAAQTAGTGVRCTAQWLDLDASIDLVRRRATEAFWLAAGVSFEARLDRELVADGDHAQATITLYNYGPLPVALGNVTVSGGALVSKPSTIVPPGGVARVSRSVSDVVIQHPWWIGKGKNKDTGLFPPSDASVDGIARPELVPQLLVVPGVAVPEGIRRATDVTVTVTVAGATVTGSIGPLVYRYADANVGVQDREVWGVPDVTLELEHPLEWFPTHKSVDRPLRIAVKSFSDDSQTFALKIVAPAGVRVDSLPASLTLAPHEERNVFGRLRGMLDTGRKEFGVYGVPAAPRTPPGRPKESRPPFLSAFQTVQYGQSSPLRMYHSSGMWLRGVDIAVSPRLGIVYVKGVPDDLPSALKEVGASCFVVGAEDLLSVNLAQITTIVLGRGAYDLHPELLAQNGRLLDFVRQGGTVVVQQSGYGAAQPRALPYPITLKRLLPERVSDANAPVTILEPKARLLNWPNAIRDDDFANWATDRASFVPTAADPRYTTLIETHDEEQPANRNTVLVAHVGKGTFVYTTLTFDQQIQGGVAGPLRLLINLLSASLPSSPAP